MTDTTLFRAARVWDGAAESSISDGCVLVDGNRIAAVGPWAEFSDRATSDPMSGTARFVDCGDATLLPGLINAHVHLTLDASFSVLADYLEERERGSDALISRAADNLRGALSAGVTTVRDCGTLNDVAFAVRSGIESGELKGPRVVTCGSPLTTTGGHCHFLGREADDEDGLRAAVRDQARAGADFIKIFATGGNLTPGTDPFAPQYSADEVRCAVDAAHHAGLAVAAHAHSPEGIANSVAAGVDTIEHCFFETREGIAYDPRIVEQIADRGIVVCPTVGARDPAMVKQIQEMPAASADPRARLLERMQEIRANFRRMFEAGVTLAAGNDAGAVSGFRFDNYPAAIGAMAGANEFPVGLSSIDALRAATSVAAGACGLSDTGLLVPGKRADLLAVDGNPLLDITDLERVQLVVSNGNVVV